MTPYEQEVLAVAIKLVREQFADVRVNDHTCGTMCAWIEVFGREHGILWKIRHALDYNHDTRETTLTFTAVTAKPVTSISVTAKLPQAN